MTGGPNCHASRFFLPALNSRRCAGGARPRATRVAALPVAAALRGSPVRQPRARRTGQPLLHRGLHLQRQRGQVRRRGDLGKGGAADVARWAPAAPPRRPRGTTAGAEVHETPRTRGARRPPLAAATGNAPPARASRGQTLLLLPDHARLELEALITTLAHGRVYDDDDDSKASPPSTTSTTLRLI